jgi:hypothetical protein
MTRCRKVWPVVGDTQHKKDRAMKERLKRMTRGELVEYAQKMHRRAQRAEGVLNEVEHKGESRVFTRLAARVRIAELHAAWYRKVLLDNLPLVNELKKG